MFDAVEYLPAMHLVHVVAPLFEPESVTEPATQTLHDESLESDEYLPAGHASHFVAFG